ncbi:hypothetical protein CTI12_AA002560 [Artemisia annua]|uniref:Uncharacterized protein n=1 Tax=Artemisia annua TaxID=35608 RepID=A0A2U1QPB1_ARTAN|nr:hypothetical protein CTI12_AA002560 [Artemisia annua]
MKMTRVLMVTGMVVMGMVVTMMMGVGGFRVPSEEKSRPWGRLTRGVTFYTTQTDMKINEFDLEINSFWSRLINGSCLGLGLEIVDKPEISSRAEVDEKFDEGSHIEEPLPSQPCAENVNNGGGDDATTIKQPPLVKVSSN